MYYRADLKKDQRRFQGLMQVGQPKKTQDKESEESLGKRDFYEIGAEIEGGLDEGRKVLKGEKVEMQEGQN
jgi:hypothetical protein